LAWATGLVIFALVDELTQMVVGRSCSGYDFLANAAGVIAGLLASSVGRRVLGRQ